MKLLELLIELRKDVLLAMGSVQDSNGGPLWDDTRPNWSTRTILQEIYERNLAAGTAFGIHTVIRHCDCPSESHSGYLIGHGKHGIKEWGDPSYIWTKDQIYQGEKLLPCPCTKNAKPTRHHIIEELVIRRHGATKRHQCFVNAVTDIQQAIDNSGDNKPRSSIREWLLKAVLQLNDAITPTTVDDYINSLSKSHTQLKVQQVIEPGNS